MAGPKRYANLITANKAVTDHAKRHGFNNRSKTGLHRLDRDMRYFKKGVKILFIDLILHNTICLYCLRSNDDKSFRICSVKNIPPYHPISENLRSAIDFIGTKPEHVQRLAKAETKDKVALIDMFNDLEEVIPDQPIPMFGKFYLSNGDVV